MSLGLTGVTDRRTRDAIRARIREMWNDHVVEPLKGMKEPEPEKEKKKTQPTGRAQAEPRWKDQSMQSAELRRDLQARGSAPTLAAAEADEKAEEPNPKNGHDAATEAVRVDQQMVAEEKSKVEASKEQIDVKTKEAVDNTFARKEDLPRGAEVVSSSDDRIEILRRDKQGNAMWREVAERDGDQLRFERTDFRDGRAKRTTLESGPDGAASRSEAWKEPPSELPSNPTTDILEARWTEDESVEISEQSYQMEEDSLIARQTSFGPDGRSEQESKYSTQEGSDGIHEEIASELDDEAQTDVVETTQLSQERGKEEEIAKQTSYSQGNVRATAVEQEGDDAPPKQWMLEKQEGDEYQAQTFVENAPKFSTITTRKAEGDSVHEEVRSTGLDAEGNDVSSNSTTDTRFDEQGLLASKHVDSTDEQGVHTVQDYTRESEETERGLEISERLQTKRTEPGDPPVELESDHQVRTLESAQGRQLLSSSNRTTSADGVAESVIDERGPRLTVNGEAVPVKENSEQLEKLSEGEIDLAAHSTADSFRELKKYAALGTAGLNLVSIGGGLPATDYDTKLSASTQERLNTRVDGLNQRLSARFGAERVNNVFRAQTIGAAGGRSVAGIFGLAAAGSALIDDVHQFNWNKAQIALDSGNVAVGGSQSVAAAKEVTALKAGSNLDEAAEAAGKFGSFARFGGLGVGVGAGGLEIFQGIRKDDKVKVAQGGVTIAGAVGSFAAIGAIGGLPGIAIGAGIGLAAFGISWGIGKLFGPDPEVAQKEI